MRLSLLTPSVARRTVVTLNLAAVLVLLILLLYDFWEFETKALPRIDQQMQLIGSSIAGSLANVHDEEQVRVAVASIAKLTADIDAKSEIPGLKTFFQVRDLQNKVVYS